MSGQGYNFDGLKAKRLRAVLEQCKRNPDYARALFGLPPRKAEKQ